MIRDKVKLANKTGLNTRSAKEMNEVYQGVPVSKGIVIGKVYKYLKEELIIEDYPISEEEVLTELEKLEEARQRANRFLKEIKEKAASELGSEETKIFDAHISMLNDPVVYGEMKDLIKKEKINAGAAVKKAIQRITDKFSRMDNEYFKERIKDIQDVGNHLLRALTGEITSLQNLPEDSIILAEDLTPSEIALIDKDRLKGLILSKGGKTSHTVIMARGLMLPVIVNVEGILDKVGHGERVILDALSGEIVVEPDRELLDKYREKINKYYRRQQKLFRLKDKSATTIDGFTIGLSANIGTDEELRGVLEVNSEGIGLFRSEFLYMNTEELPDEEKQFKVYREVVEEMAGKPVIIRTLDTGGDKGLPGLELPDELNPFLGWRAIRISLERRDIFKTQLKALLRARYYGNLKIMFPLISSLEELREAKRILKEVKGELDRAGIPYDPDIEVGMMVEVPAAAILADIFAREVDFFSIGTNDLIQYIVAVDRTNDKIANLNTPYHPAVLRVIKEVVEAAYRAGIWVGICGEAGGDSLLTPFFIGLGVNELSMSVGAILEIKDVVRQLKREECKGIVEDVLKLSTAEEVKEYLTEVRKKKSYEI
ncbi:MAG: phosphoenolpyruvate-protein phosphotransferase system enzyme [Halanaerobiales bacterium]|nr:phosphoenolpyruvate-protein phosphotransferase system enzyme [Halanaerobiales bacterium]